MFFSPASFLIAGRQMMRPTCHQGIHALCRRCLVACLVTLSSLTKKATMATIMTATVNQFTRIQELRCRWTRKIGLYSAANTPKIKPKPRDPVHTLQTPNTRIPNSKSTATVCRNRKGYSAGRQHKRVMWQQPATRHINQQGASSCSYGTDSASFALPTAMTK
jgi:hypothetical protein